MELIYTVKRKKFFTFLHSANFKLFVQRLKILLND